MNRFFLGILFFLFSVSATIGQEATPLSLKMCMDYAINHNVSIKNSKIDVLIQQAQNNQTLSAAYPHISGKMEVDDFLAPQKQFVDASSFSPSVPKGTITPISFSLNYASTIGVSASQLIFDGSVFVAVKARNTIMELARQNGAVSEENIRYNIYKAYNALVIAYRQFGIVKSSLTYARSLEHDVIVTHQTGFAEKIDEERTSVQVNNLASDSIRIANLLTVSEQMLKYQIGMDINATIILTDTVLEQRKEDAFSLLNMDKNYDRVPEYNLLKTALKLNEFNLERYKLSAIPTVAAFGAMGYNYGSNKFGDVFKFNDYAFNSTIGLQITVPIFNGFMRANQITEAKLNIEKTNNNIDFLKQSLDFQSAVSKTNLKNSIIQVQSQRRNMDLANDVLDLAQKKYKAGVGSNLEVTQAQTDLLRAQNNYFSALLDIINAEADLKKALGLLKN